MRLQAPPLPKDAEQRATERKKSGAPAVTLTSGVQPIVRTLVLRTVELQKLHSLDPHGQRFQATLWTEWAFHGGRHDADLSAEGSVFPMGPDGRPTYRPSAKVCARLNAHVGLPYPKPPVCLRTVVWRAGRLPQRHLVEDVRRQDDVPR